MALVTPSVEGKGIRARREKISASEKVQNARENGFDDDVACVDGSVVHRPLVPWTSKLYKDTWEIWIEYRKTHPEADPCEIQTAKHFVELLCAVSRGHGDGGKASDKTIYQYWRRFFSMWARETCNEIPHQVKASVQNYIFGELVEQKKVTKYHRARGFLTVANQRIMLKFLWSSDWHEYNHDGTRINNTISMHIFTYTPTRLGEVYESTARQGSGKGLHYGNMWVAVAWRKILRSSNGMVGSDRNTNAYGSLDIDRVPYILVGYCREYAKAMQDLSVGERPQHALYEGQAVPIEDPIFFILASALASNAFQDYSTIEEILKVRPALDMDYVPLRWKRDMLSKPFLQRMNSVGPTGKIGSACSFNKSLGDWSERAGFEERVKVHDGRREALIKADDNGYSVDERMVFAGHRNPRTFRKNYTAPMSTVDGQGSFLGTELRKDHLEVFRSMSKRRNPQLWQSLPAKEQDNLERRADFVAISDRIDSLTEDIQRKDVEDEKRELRARRQELYEERSRLTVSELKKLREAQGHVAESQHSTDLEDYHRTLFARRRHLMPERDFLADALFIPTPLRSDKGIEIVKNLISLYRKDCQNAYHPNMRPNDDNDQCQECRIQMHSLKADKRWFHIYQCTKGRFEHLFGFARFCFQCNKWITIEEKWIAHCQNHLNQPGTIPLQCEPLIFRHALVTCGHCPFCLGDSKLSAPDRMYQFLHIARWREHIAAHIEKAIRAGEKECRFPLCARIFPSTQDLLYHLQDVHIIKLPKKTSEAIQKPLNASERSCDKTFGSGFVNYSLKTFIAPGTNDKPATGKRKRTNACQRATIVPSSESDDGLGNSSVALSSSDSEDSIDDEIENPTATSSLSRDGDINHGWDKPESSSATSYSSQLSEVDDDWINVDANCSPRRSSVTSASPVPADSLRAGGEGTRNSQRAEPSPALKIAPINETPTASRELSSVRDCIPPAKRRAVAVVIPLRAKDGASTPARGQQDGRELAGRPRGRPTIQKDGISPLAGGQKGKEKSAGRPAGRPRGRPRKILSTSIL